MRKSLGVVCLIVAALLSVSCSSSPPPETGFLGDYTALKKEDNALRYVSPKLKNYSAFIVEPVQIQVQKNLNDKERAEVAEYFHQEIVKDLQKRGYAMSNSPGPGVARVRIAITNIQDSKWYLNLHPLSKVTGVGTGGASMEGELLDSQTGEQLAAVVQAGKGNQFELDTFSKLDDVKDTIHKWVETAGNRIDHLRKGA